MKPLLTLLLSCLSACAASPSFSSFNTNQFSTNNLFISIKDGVLITNINGITTISLNGTNIVNLFAPSSVTNGPVGTTINPTDNYIPVRSGATTFADSGLYRVGVTNIATDGQIILGPGTTNVLYRSGSDLVYTNATTGSMYFEMRKETAGKVAKFGMGSGGNPTILAGTGLGVVLAPDNASQTMFAVVSGFYPSATTLTLGTATAGNQWGALYLGGSAPSVVWNGTTNTVFDSAGTGTPEGVVTASPGSTYRNYSGGAGTTFYVKESGTASNTGWVPK